MPVATQSVELYIVRHGIAEVENPGHRGSDHHRRLTARGVSKTREAAVGMRAIGVDPAAIWTSPHLRAVETAGVVAEVLRPSGGVIEHTSLSFAGSPAQVRAELAGAELGALMLVGHEPMLAELVSDLAASGHLRLGLRKASLVHLRLHRVPRGVVGELVSFIPPRLLRALGRVEAIPIESP